MPVLMIFHDFAAIRRGASRARRRDAVRCYVLWSNVYPSCGCLAATSWNSAIAPVGESRIYFVALLDYGERV